MQVKFYGTRGSIPIARDDATHFGGNTTSLRIISDCIPPGCALVVDAGSGFVPLSKDLLSSGIMRAVILFTHWHHDHNQGFLLAPHTFIPAAQIDIYGPKEHGTGPQEVLESLMRPPLFPVDYGTIRHRVSTHNLETIGTQVLVVHPEGGFQLMKVHIFEQETAQGKQLAFGKAGRFPVRECLVIRMHKTVHPEYTVSYRFEERPTDRTFVFLTDHENTDGTPRDFIAHIKGAHLLVQDCQYSREMYDRMTAGFGHGTPDFCAQIAIRGGAQRLGLTHHDPSASDEDVMKRLAEAKAYALGQDNALLAENIFACADLQTENV